MNGASQNGNPQLAQYFVDFNLAEEFSQSSPFMISERLCFMCSMNYRNRSTVAPDPWILIADIVTHCAKERDYLLPDTPLKEAIFRVLLVNGPMDSEQISNALSEKWSMSAFPRNTTPRVIQRLLEGGIYHCVGAASEQDVQDWLSQVDDASRKREQSRREEISSPSPEKGSTIKKRKRPSKELDAPGLPQREVKIDDPGDPFALSDEPIRESASPELGIQFEKLLYWLSAVGGGTWQTFAQACVALGVVDERQHARSVLRRLRLLGHVDSSQDGSHWEVSPAALVLLPIQPEKGFLAGQRVPSLVEEEGGIHGRTHQPDYQGPPRVEIVPDGSHARISTVGQTATKLAELLPAINEWMDSLQQMPKLLTTQFDLQIWDGRQFEPCNTFYERDGRYYGTSGMYRLSRSENKFSYETTLFFDEPNQRWLRGDWYGLRFLAVGTSGSDAIHDPDANILLVPAAQRWPLLYERALVLASGLLPGSTDSRNWLRYQGIPLDLALTLCRKLNVRLRQETNNA